MRATFGLCIALAMGCAGGSDDTTDAGSDLGGDDALLNVKPSDIPITTDTPAGDVAAQDGADAGPACTGDDDCVAPDLCTNAQRCRFGHCETIGGPAACNDMVACTDDACDPTRGRCVHTANDVRCTGGEFCGGSAGCVRELPCELGDSTCARLSSDACGGTWSCSGSRRVCVRSGAFNCDDMDACTMDTCSLAGTAPMCAHMGPDYQTDPMHCGRCMNRCPSGPHQVAVCAAAVCSAQCEAGYVDQDHNAANGCECHGADEDRPDPMFQDTNCDGIDGDASRAVFVSTSGNDMAPGTREMPMLTLAAAIAAAARATPVRSVYIAAGTYTGPITLVSGVGLYGGYDDMNAWSRDRLNTTVLHGGTTAVTAEGLTAATEVQLLSIQAETPTTAGLGSYGVRVLNSSATLTLRGCVVTAAAGAAGVVGRTGASGANGGNGGAGSTSGAGASGTSTCGVRGGNGGAQRSGTSTGFDGEGGLTVSGGGSAGGPGHAGSSGSCTLGFDSSGGGGSDGLAGGGGTNGTNAPTAPAFGAISPTSGLYVAPMASNGVSGTHGGGGGGGGSGGGSAHSCGFLGRGCCDSTSGGGGGGGGGGCGGAGGTGGGGGGASIAVLALASNVVLSDTRLFTGRGGAGGAGGGGGAAGNGGAPGGGGARGDNAGNGGSGARGGNGGAGGNGAGGPGGPSVCVYYVGMAPMLDASVCSHGPGGAGGAGGTSTALGRAPDGPPGVSDEVRAGM